MGDLSQHFDRKEFRCKCNRCKQDTVDHELIIVLEWLRRRTGASITISSGNRCYEHNIMVGGAPKSKHLFSIAADIKVKGHDPSEIYRLLDEQYPNKYGLKQYSSWVHVDVRMGKWRGK